MGSSGDVGFALQLVNAVPAVAELPLAADHLGHHAPANLLLGFQARSSCIAARIGAVLVQLGNRQQRLEQFVHPVAGRSAGPNDFRVAAPLAAQEFVGGQLLGFLGMMLAVPLTSILIAVFQALYKEFRGASASAPA